MVYLVCSQLWSIEAMALHHSLGYLGVVIALVWLLAQTVHLPHQHTYVKQALSVCHHCHRPAIMVVPSLFIIAINIRRHFHCAQQQFP